MKHLDDFVEIAANHSIHYKPDEMIHICKRRENPNRDFLFANQCQGKHIPVRPSMVLDLFLELLMQIYIGIRIEEKVAVIGFAETATAIGTYIGKNLSNCVYYTQTTRETYDAEVLVEFSEEHSHAPTQLIYGSTKQLESCSRIIFVEDEISTGKTILNFVEKLREIGINPKFSVASIVNWQDDSCKAIFDKEGIDTYYVIKGKLKNLDSKVYLSEELPDEKVDEILPMNCVKTFFNKKPVMNERLGVNPMMLSETEVLEEFFNGLELEAPEKKESILVLGTEEYMYKPLMLAYRLESFYPNKEVYFHATTRSPIATSLDEGYILNRRYKVASAYSPDRDTFVYNLKKYDCIFVVTDGDLRADFIFSITQALAAAGNDCEIKFVNFKGGTR